MLANYLQDSLKRTACKKKIGQIDNYLTVIIHIYKHSCINTMPYSCLSNTNTLFWALTET